MEGISWVFELEKWKDKKVREKGRQEETRNNLTDSGLRDCFCGDSHNDMKTCLAPRLSWGSADFLLKLSLPDGTPNLQEEQ